VSAAAPRTRATAFAPASVGNVAIGFDILGFAVDALGDRVTVARSAAPGVRISAVRGIAGELPQRPEDNTAGRALLAMQEAVEPPFGFAVEIDKGIPLGSGLGGSAASAVGAVVAANALLREPCGQLELLKFAMAGEAVNGTWTTSLPHSTAGWCSRSASIPQG
jgi:homoserine kinase